MTSVWASGWVCEAVRALGSSVTGALEVRDGAFALKSGSIRTEPVKFSAGPWRDGCEPLRVTVIDCEDSPEQASRQSSMTITVSSLISYLPNACVGSASFKGACAA